jgi:cyclopropane fatty-acyl-phospholipid synthase-like methyltransferase
VGLVGDSGVVQVSEQIDVTDPEPGEPAVARHYTRNALLSAMLDALAAAGKPTASIDSDDLSPMDEMHTGARAATVEVADLLAPESGATIFDLGCGLGGVSRYLARHRGCEVTGFDLTREHVDVAADLTERCGLSGSVQFHRADITAIDRASASCDGTVLMHVGMNVADKAALCGEVFRLLRPGGRFVLYDIVLLSSTDELTYPVPWASSAEISFLEPAREYHRLLTHAGFTVENELDRRERAIGQLERLLAFPADQLPPIGMPVVMGPGWRTRVTNLHDGLTRGVVAPVVLTATR